ncbi:MAG: hypothetical protein WBL63_22135 [Candidatus Acidiferrum sp.]
MKKHRILLSGILLVLSLGEMTPQSAQEVPKGSEKSDLRHDHALLLGFLRTINTAEVDELSTYGAYASWQTLLAHQQQFLQEWLTRFYSQDTIAHFGSTSEILPGWNLRLDVQTGGKGYVAFLEDAKDKTGYAAVTDERAVIRECKYLQ